MNGSGAWYIAAGVWHGNNYPAEGGGGATKDQVDTSTSSSLTTAFHTFGLEWDDTKQAFYLDDRPFGTVTAHVVTSNPFYVLLQLAIDGNIGTDATTAPRALEVDWVRAYEKATVSSGAPSDCGSSGATGGAGNAGGGSPMGGTTGGGTAIGGVPSATGGIAGSAITGGGAAGSNALPAVSGATDHGCGCALASLQRRRYGFAVLGLLMSSLLRRRRAP